MGVKALWGPVSLRGSRPIGITGGRLAARSKKLPLVRLAIQATGLGSEPATPAAGIENLPPATGATWTAMAIERNPRQLPPAAGGFRHMHHRLMRGSANAGSFLVGSPRHRPISMRPVCRATASTVKGRDCAHFPLGRT